MATYRSIATTETDPQAPVTSALMKALEANPLAIAEDDSTAPKIKVTHRVSGAGAQSQTFTGLGDYSGISFEIKARNNSGAARNLTIEYSTNGGSSWSSATTIHASSASEQLNVSGAFDFSSGTLMAIIGSAVQSQGPGRINTTMAGASLSIDAIRFAWSGTNTELVALIRPNGGSV